MSVAWSSAFMVLATITAGSLDRRSLPRAAAAQHEAAALGGAGASCAPPVPGNQGRNPASIDEHSVDVARQPAAFDPVELIMRATRCQGPVARQAMEGCVHATPTVSAALIVVHRHVAPVWRMMPRAVRRSRDNHADSRPALHELPTVSARKRTRLRAVTVPNLTDVAAQRRRRGMNELLAGQVYQQSVKSPPSATGCTRSASAMIASALTTG